ncbi:hypothetical protein, partial [Candidatus Symbiothrix dinenymphae]|uniref:hypothetical protein n=1 Tax=Candidatus Symbiothrix dinenymphae TaxID=467085 RepID=UPI000A7EDF78
GVQSASAQGASVQGAYDHDFDNGEFGMKLWVEYDYIDILYKYKGMTPPIDSIKVEYSINGGVEWIELACFVNDPVFVDVNSLLRSKADETIEVLTAEEADRYPIRYSAGNLWDCYANVRWRPNRYISNLNIRVKGRRRQVGWLVWAGYFPFQFGSLPMTKPQLHKPEITGYEILGDGRIEVKTNIPGFTPFDDMGEANHTKMSLFVLEDLLIYKSPTPESEIRVRWNSGSPKPVAAQENSMDTLCTRDQYSKNIELKVKTARTDYYKLP